MKFVVFIFSTSTCHAQSRIDYMFGVHNNVLRSFHAMSGCSNKLTHTNTTLTHIFRDPYHQARFAISISLSTLNSVCHTIPPNKSNPQNSRALRRALLTRTLNNRNQLTNHTQTCRISTNAQITHITHRGVS